MALAYQPRDETLGRYRLFARLGRGGMAELFVARLIGAARVEKLVAIKRMLPHLVEDPQFVAMFENEGRIAARLTHPNVCQTYELDEADGQLFLVMEFLRGLAWSEIVVALPVDELARTRFIVGMLVQACEGLHYAHNLVDPNGQSTPVVHRDVSPGNLMITTDGVIKLLDFGVSKMLTEGSATRTGMIKGKLPYMAPEQIRGEQVDGRADIFSLGVVLWESLSGTRLFDRNSDFQIWKAVTEDPIPRLPDTPITASLEVVVQRALARDRTHRQPTARMFADELRDALAPYGAPMSQGEIQQAIATWMHGSLARESRDLAAAISQLRQGDAEAALTRQIDISHTSVDLVVGRAPVTQVIGGADVPISPLVSWGELANAVLEPADEDVTEDDPGASGRARAQPANRPGPPSPSRPSEIQLREVSVIVTNPDDVADEQPTRRAPASTRTPARAVETIGPSEIDPPTRRASSSENEQPTRRASASEVQPTRRAPVTSENEQPTRRAPVASENEQPTRRAPASIKTPVPRAPDPAHDLDAPVITPPHIREAVRAIESSSQPLVPTMMSIAPTGPRRAPIPEPSDADELTSIAPTTRRDQASIVPTVRRMVPPAPIHVPRPNAPRESVPVVETELLSRLGPRRRWWIPVLVLSIGGGVAAAIAMSGGQSARPRAVPGGAAFDAAPIAPPGASSITPDPIDAPFTPTMPTIAPDAGTPNAGSSASR